MWPQVGLAHCPGLDAWWHQSLLLAVPNLQLGQILAQPQPKITTGASRLGSLQLIRHSGASAVSYKCGERRYHCSSLEALQVQLSHCCSLQTIRVNILSLFLKNKSRCGAYIQLVTGSHRLSYLRLSVSLLQKNKQHGSSLTRGALGWGVTSVVRQLRASRCETTVCRTLGTSVLVSSWVRAGDLPTSFPVHDTSWTICFQFVMVASWLLHSHLSSSLFGRLRVRVIWWGVAGGRHDNG